jgi:hypothetical protein
LPTRCCIPEGRTLQRKKEREEREQAENEEKIKKRDRKMGMEKGNEEKTIYKKKMEEVAKWHIITYFR